MTTWTDERVAQLKELWAAGHSAKVIAGNMGGLTRSAVIGKINRLGLPIPEKKLRSVGLRRPPRDKRISEKRLKRTNRLVFSHKSRNFVLVPDFSFQDLAPPAKSLGLTLFQLKDGQCRYASGGDDGEPFLFCGQPVQEGSSYCPACHARCWVKPHKRTERGIEWFANRMAGAA